MKSLFIIAFLVFSSWAKAQQDFAMIVTANHSVAVNYPNFDHNALKAYRTFSLSGINRDKISILTGDGANPFVHDSLIDLAQLKAGIPAADQHIDGRATKKNIKARFIAMGAKMKPGDHFNLFITGHGHNNAGKITIRLWENEILTIEELRSYLKLLPAGVTKHIMGSYCYAGSLMPLTSEPNTCAFSPVDEKTSMHVDVTTTNAQGKKTAIDTYTDVMFDTLLKGKTYEDSQKNADRVDTYNSSSLNSLDWYLNKFKPNQGFDCDKIPDNQIDKLMRNSLIAVSVNKPAKESYSDYLAYFKQYKNTVAQMTLKFNQLTPVEQKAKRGEFTKMIEQIKQNLNSSNIQNKPTYLRAMAREQEFIEKATPAQLKKYLEIKTCVNYAIK